MDLLKIKEIQEKIDDLIEQATKEKSHYYTKSVLEECRLALSLLTQENRKLKLLIKGLL